MDKYIDSLKNLLTTTSSILSQVDDGEIEAGFQPANEGAAGACLKEQFGDHGFSSSL